MSRTSRTVLILSACGAVFFSSADAAAQLGVEWVARYRSNQSAAAIAVDDSEYVYVTGSARGSGLGGRPDYATIKYSETGDTIWVRRYNGPGDAVDNATDLTVDDSGYVYVTGTSDADFLTIKYSPFGDTVWTRRYGLGQEASQIAVDDSSYIYVTGRGGGGFATIKYSSIGDTVWISSSATVSPINEVHDLEVDENGNVYVTGSDFVPIINISTGTTIKYAPNGDTLWVRFNGGHDLAIDDSGYVYATGYAFLGGTIKYSSTGDSLWGSYGASFIATDHNGNAYTVHRYGTISKYSPAGNLLWTRTHPADDFDSLYFTASALTLDDSGHVYVTGTYEEYLDAERWRIDYMTTKYLSTGDIAWMRRYNGLDSDGITQNDAEDYATDLALDTEGNAYVTGGSFGYYVSGYATIKYSNPTGDVNCDGFIDLVDVVLLGNVLDGLTTLDSTCGQMQADVDADGVVDEDDYNLLYDIVAGVGP